MKKVTVYVTLRESVVDPQGAAATKALQEMGHDNVKEVRIGKLIELQVDATENIEEQVTEMCETLLINRVIEDYRFDIEEA